MRGELRGDQPPTLKLRRAQDVGGQINAGCSSKVVHAQSASLNDALKRADWDRFVAVHGDDYLPTVRVARFLMAALLTDLAKAMLSQDSNNFFAAANGKALTHSLPLISA